MKYTFSLFFRKTEQNPYGNPPRTTDQQKKIRVVHGKPMKYAPASVQHAREEFIFALHDTAPNERIRKPVKLSCVWRFYRKGAHGAPKITRPDTDNLQKMLKDVMTSVGWWEDDAVVYAENAVKVWDERPRIDIEVETED